MRRLISKLALTAAALLIISVPVLADDLSVVPEREPAAVNPGKDVCLIVAMNCGDRAESIQNRIEFIQSEINKGSTVYTNEELMILQKKLDAEKRELNEAYEGGA